MKYLSVILVSGCMLSMVTAGTVIDFNDSSDLSDHFNLTGAKTDFWTYTPNAGLNGSGGLTGDNGGQNGFIVYREGQQLAPSGETHISGGIFLQLAPTTGTSPGYHLAIGLAPSADYSANEFDPAASPKDPAQNHLAGMLHYNRYPEDRKFRLGAFSVSEGAVEQDITSYETIDLTSWYYLSLDVVYNGDDDVYSFTTGLYETTASGEIADRLFVQEMVDVSIPGLSAAGENWLWVGLPYGRAETRGLASIDRFVTSIPEPSHYAFFAGSALLIGVLILRRRN